MYIRCSLLCTATSGRGRQRESLYVAIETGRLFARIECFEKIKLYNGLRMITEELIVTNRFLTENDKREICSWKYEGEYAIYNLPSYEEMSESEMGFMNPNREKNYHSFFTDGKLVGFVNIREEPTEVFIGTCEQSGVIKMLVLR
jgi:hypothetical protein